MSPSVTHHDLSTQDLQYLKDIDYLRSLDISPEEEVLHSLDCIQSSNEEKQALHEFTLHCLHSDGKEWVNEEFNVGSEDDYDNYEWYTQLLDEAEMNMDMGAFVDNNTCHELFANNPWETRDMEASATKVSKRSGFHAWGEVSQVGENYATAETDYGKVYIPIHFVHQLGVKHSQLLFMCLTFKGFGECRATNMPWRCSFINMNS